MSLETYDGLKTEIASYIARSDVTASSAVIDTFIDLAEAYFNKRLRVIRMQKDVELGNSSSLITTEDGSSILFEDGSIMALEGSITSSIDLTLPSDFLEIYTLEHQSDTKDLEYIPRSSFKKHTTYSGRPSAFTLIYSGDSHAIKLYPYPDSSYKFDLVYYAKIPALSSSRTTNWLLIDYPELYLNACLYFAFKRYRSPIAADYKALTEDDIKTLNMEDEKIHTGGGGMRQRITGTIV